MNYKDQWIEANLKGASGVPKLSIVFMVLIVVGAAGFFVDSGGSLRAMQAYWVNFLFFAGIAQGAVILAVIVNITKGKWGGPILRMGLMNVSFIPVTLLLYIGIVFFAGDIVPWIIDPSLAASKTWWLEQGFFLIRTGAFLLVMTLASLYFAYKTLRPEAGFMAENGHKIYPAFLYRNFKGYEEEKEKSQKSLRIFAPVFCFVFAVAYSFIGFDMMMSLDPHWFSTLFGLYFVITCVYSGIAMVVLLSSLLQKPLGIAEYIGSKRYHDVGKLLFAFCILATDFLWSQFLVIWYGDLPEENYFILQRISEQPWVTLSWVVLLCGFVIPFVVLLNKKIKTMPSLLSVVALVIMVGIFFEKGIIVLRSLHAEAGAGFPIGIVEIMVTVGFLGLYGLAILWALKRLPVVPPETFIKEEH